MRKSKLSQGRWSSVRQTKQRVAAARERVVVLSWDRSSAHRIVPATGAAPYERCYEVTRGYCTERSIVLP
ncbi:MAG TPA: hypothetical protein VMN60_05800 [Longimicrobiales bacterium]|nr:hypothetical protein [Longimicrobiales bacterium]